MMVTRMPWYGTALLLLLAWSAWAQEVGSIRGVVRDAEFDLPLGAAQVQIAETGAKVSTTAEGQFSFGQVAPGTYTLVIVRDGYARHVRSDVVVTAGQLTDVSVVLSGGDVTEIEDVMVQPVRLGGGTEEGLLQLRMEAPALVDSVSSKLMSLAGAGDAAAGLRLVAGATVQDGKYAVVRGLPERYVVAQMNSVRLPTADADKRAVQLDQFPAAAIESIQVAKTFTPDQQADASGGAVNIVLKGVPEKPFLQLRLGTGFNTRQPSSGRYLSYGGGGVSTWGRDDGGRDIQPEFHDPIFSDGVYEGAAGLSHGDVPWPYNWAVSTGGSFKLLDDLRIGGLVSLFYERKNYFREGQENKAWVNLPGEPITPQYSQGTPSGGDFRTSLLDVAQNTTEVKYGGLFAVGLESTNHKLKVVYLGTSSTQDTVTLAEDTRGKSYFFPGYDPANPDSPGFRESSAAPWLRAETLAYSERTTDTFQLSGWHRLADVELTGDRFSLLPPELDWTVAVSSASFDEPDKRRFGSGWLPGYTIGSFTRPGQYFPAKDAANFTLGNLQRTWREVTEGSEQYFVNLKLPFKQWTETEGYFKVGLFHDRVERAYRQQSFSNFNDPGGWVGEWDQYWSAQFARTHHKIYASEIDVDYDAEQEISAWYLMADVPLTSWLSVVGGARFEKTDLSITNTAEPFVTWVPPGSTSSVTLNPGEADVAFAQTDVLPSIGLVLRPLKEVTIRASYSETVARQTFKELTPIQQQEYLGADIFVGNPLLRMSSLKNYDLRIDYTPHPSTFLSASYFYKDVTDPIEYVQRSVDFTYTTAENYPDGTLKGFEFEVRQQLGAFTSALEGLSVGANATFIKSRVTLPEDEVVRFASDAIRAPMTSRDMAHAPKYLLNLYATYDVPKLGTQLGVFYTVRGETLIAGAGTGSSSLVPSVYELPYGTLNVTLTQKLDDHWKISVQAKNLLDPAISSVYRNHLNGEEFTKTEYHRGIEVWFTISAEW